jgi:hypothetical protein
VRQSGTLSGGDDGFKAHALGAVQTGLVLEFGGDFDFLDARAHQVEDVFEELAASEGGRGHQLQLVFVFEEAEWLNERRGEGGKESAAEF